MYDVGALWEELAQARRDLLYAAAHQTSPPHEALTALENWREDLSLLPSGEMTAGRLAHAWGELQLILIEGETEGGLHGPAWRRVRRAAEEGFQRLFTRPEWSSLQVDLREEVLPLLADAVVQGYHGRIIRCAMAVSRLRAFAHRTSGQPHAWLLRRVAEMTYPHVTPAGWFARMGVDFTWRRARAVIEALLEEIGTLEVADAPLIVGFDSRIHAGEMADLVIEIAAEWGQPVHLCQRDAPLPALREYLIETLHGRSAGLVICTAGTLPVKEHGRFTGQSYQGLSYLLPDGASLSEEAARRISRHAAENLLDMPECEGKEIAGHVTMMNPQQAYGERLLDELDARLLRRESEEESAREVILDYWGQSKALIVVDEMHGTLCGYVDTLLSQMSLPADILHGEADPLFGPLDAARPEPPQLDDLISRIREQQGEWRPVIGLAVDAAGECLGVVDENGMYLPPSAVFALLTEYLLSESTPGEPGAIVRSRTVSRLADRLTSLPAYAGKVLPPQYRDHLPPYMLEPDYQRLTGDPYLLHPGNVHVEEGTPVELPAPLLLAGDADGRLLTYLPSGWDALRAALLLLELCAMRQKPVGALWEEMQLRAGPSYMETLELSAPDDLRLTLINRYLRRYANTTENQLRSAEYQLGRCEVHFAGGVPDRFIEWALRDKQDRPAYLSVTLLLPQPLLRIEAEAASAEIAHRLVLAIAERVEMLLKEQFQRAETPWQIIDILTAVTSPLEARAELPGTLTCRLAEEAYSRLQEFTRPGREAPELLRFVTERLRESHPEAARAFAACRLYEQPSKKKKPPRPRVHWESEGDI